MNIKDVKYGLNRENIIKDQADEIHRYLYATAEYGCADEGERIFSEFLKDIQKRRDEFEALLNKQKSEDEPETIEEIRKLRPDGPRKMTDKLPKDYFERLKGAFYGRMAGCTLGAALEFQPVEAMEAWALQFNDEYPLKDYWSYVKNPQGVHYIVGKKVDLTKGNMDAVPPDDDTIYTLLGLLLMEEYGFDFTHEQMAEIWQKYLPIEDEHGNRGCYWGERNMMINLKNGMKLPEAGFKNNPNIQNIAGWTRADSYGYVCPGWPEKAAYMAFVDCSINHKRNGVYGAMFMAAAISAAFVVDDPIEAVKIGLTEIPENCLFAEGIRFALANKSDNYKEACQKLASRYGLMFRGSAINNAIRVVMGIDIGDKDFSRTIGETIAMSGDNDCTGATAGSILGAVIGKSAIPSNWTEPFNGRMHIYLKDMPEYLEIDKVCERYKALAEKMFMSKSCTD